MPLLLSAASLDTALFREVDAVIRKEMRTYEVHGAAAAVFNEKSILWQKAFGFDDENEKRLASLDSPYRIGGLTELWVAALVLQFSDEKKLDLTAPVTRYLPDLRLADGNEKRLTLTHLLTHHSGLPLDWYGEKNDLKNLLTILGKERLLAPPGTRHLRSVIDYELIGHLLERFSGKSLDLLLEERLFLPLGMNRSHLARSDCRDSQTGPGWRSGDKDILRFEDPPCRARAAGGGISTIYDMSRFMQMLFNDGWTGAGRILSHESVARMLSATHRFPGDIAFSPTFGGYHDYFPFSAPNFAAIGTAGGFVTLVAAFPGHKLGILIFGNTESFVLGAPNASSHILALLGKSIGITTPPVPPERPVTPADIERLRPLQGRYVGNRVMVDVTIEKDKPVVHWGTLTLTMVPVSPTRFRLAQKLFFWIKEYYIDLKESPDRSVVALLSVQLDEYGFPLSVFHRPPPITYPDSVKSFIGGYRPVPASAKLAARTRYDAFQIRWDGPWLIAETNREKILLAPCGENTLCTNDAVIRFSPNGSQIGAIVFEKWF